MSENNSEVLQSTLPPVLRTITFGEQGLYIVDGEFAVPCKSVPIITDRDKFAELVSKNFHSLCNDIGTKATAAQVDDNGFPCVELFGNKHPVMNGDEPNIELSGAHHLVTIMNPDNEDEWTSFTMGIDVPDKYRESSDDNQIWFVCPVETSVPGVSCTCNLCVEQNHHYKEEDCRSIMVEQGVLQEGDSKYGCMAVSYRINAYFHIEDKTAAHNSGKKRGAAEDYGKDSDDKKQKTVA